MRPRPPSRHATPCVHAQAIGFSGYHLFGSATKTNILINFDKPMLKAHPALSTPLRIGQLSMALCLILSAPVANWPFRSCVLSVVLRWRHGRPMASDDASDSEWAATTSLCLALVVFLSLCVPDVKTPLSIVGSVAGSLIIFVLPALFLFMPLPDRTWAAWWEHSPIAVCLLVTGCILGPCSLAMVLYHDITGEDLF